MFDERDDRETSGQTLLEAERSNSRLAEGGRAAQVQLDEGRRADGAACPSAAWRAAHAEPRDRPLRSRRSGRPPSPGSGQPPSLRRGRLPSPRRRPRGRGEARRAEETAGSPQGSASSASDSRAGRSDRGPAGGGGRIPLLGSYVAFRSRPTTPSSLRASSRSRPRSRATSPRFR